MQATDPNLPQLRRIAEALGELRAQMVFVGGAVAGLLITDPLADSVRATRDVDAVVAAGLSAYYRLEDELATRGFRRDTQGGVICRWMHEASGLLFDLMPVQADVLGFSNRWYPYAVETAVPVTLDNGISIRLVSAVAFMATKLEAFVDRGAGDLLGSHDLEDVLNIVDGREELAEELAAAPAGVRQHIASTVAALLANPDFLNVLPGLIAEPERAPTVLARLEKMSA